MKARRTGNRQPQHLDSGGRIRGDVSSNRNSPPCLHGLGEFRHALLAHLSGVVHQLAADAHGLAGRIAGRTRIQLWQGFHTCPWLVALAYLLPFLGLLVVVGACLVANHRKLAGRQVAAVAMSPNCRGTSAAPPAIGPEVQPGRQFGEIRNHVRTRNLYRGVIDMLIQVLGTGCASARRCTNWPKGCRGNGRRSVGREGRRHRADHGLRDLL